MSKKTLLSVLCALCFTLSLNSQSVAFTSWTSFDTSNTQDLYWRFDADSVYFGLDNINWTGVAAYWETGPTIRLVDSPSTGQCLDTGYYLESYSGDTLWLTLVSDTCADRVLYLGTHYFINQLTSVVSQNEAIPISVSPNPSSGQFTVTSTVIPDRIMMFDVTGKVVYDEKPSTNATTICPQHATPGVFIVKVYFNEQSAVKRIVIE